MQAKILQQLLGVACAALAIDARADDLFFSEYVEGSLNNKALEIFNPTGAAVDLSGYVVEIYVNGAAAPSNSLALSGVLEPSRVWVIANASAATAILDVADVATNTVCNFTGDDALVLRHDGTIVDSIGQVGVDPGTKWGTAPDATMDQTLRREPYVCAGEANATDAYDPGQEWEGFASDTVDGLGSHVAGCAEVVFRDGFEAP